MRKLCLKMNENYNYGFIKRLLDIKLNSTTHTIHQTLQSRLTVELNTKATK
jgi:hypothetical protein